MDRVKLKEFITKGVDSHIRIAGEKDFLKTLAEDAKDVFDMKTADFNARVKAAYDLYEAKEKIRKSQEVIDELEEMGFN